MPNTPATLPTWAQMSDLDKGTALLHLNKCASEGSNYAAENYPARYFDHPALTALTPEEACQHALSLEDDADQAWRDGEAMRLYDLALDADHARWKTEHPAK